jgi:hypothetical protein
VKGALIHFGAPMLVPVPNVIVFQYNPETLSRTLTPWEPLELGYTEAGERELPTKRQLAALRQPFDPQELISLTLELDATDQLEFPERNRVAFISGVADRLAALEMLLYPPEEGDEQLVTEVASTLGPNSLEFEIVPRRDVPIVLFFWGASRLVPVRVTTFSVEEQAFSPILAPIRAKVNLGMRVLDEDDLVNLEGQQRSSGAVKVAKAAYAASRVQKEALATVNVTRQVLGDLVNLLPL